MFVGKLNNNQFKKYCDLVYREAGINLTEEKRELLNSRITKCLQRLNIDSDDYYRLIQKNPNELRKFIDAVSTNHTFFFRESNSFKSFDKSCKTIWCAASSSGEEPFSIAIYCLERGFRPSIIATDISESCLEKGKKGIYPEQCVDSIPRHIVTAYFQKGHGKFQNYVKVKSDVKRMVKFQRFNLIKDIPMERNFDIIFCRNVMIYFDNATKNQVINKLAKVLRKDGYFIIGGAESLSNLNHPLKYVKPSIYVKI